MVMPRSRSRSIRSRNCSRISRSETAWVSSSNRSASVDLPWSMWATMQKFLMRLVSTTDAPACAGMGLGVLFPYGLLSYGPEGLLKGSRGADGPAGRIARRGQHQVSEEAQPAERASSRAQQVGAQRPQDRGQEGPRH